MPQPHSPLKTWQVWSLSRRESVKSDWTKTAVVRYCSTFLSNTFKKKIVVSAWVLCGSVPYSILCCGFVRLWSSINSVWFTAAVVSRSWLKEGRPLSMAGTPCIHAQWKRRHCRRVWLTYLHLCSVSVRLVPPKQGSSCWWLEA